jgi:Uma2 family endonuclease
LSQDPPPDLAIEVDLTSLTKIDDYLQSAIPEVWIYRAGNLHIYQFSDSFYSEVNTSQLFPEFPVKAIVPRSVSRAWEAGSSVALREVEQSFNDPNLLRFP